MIIFDKIKTAGITDSGEEKNIKITNINNITQDAPEVKPIEADYSIDPSGALDHVIVYCKDGSQITSDRAMCIIPGSVKLTAICNLNNVDVSAILCGMGSICAGLCDGNPAVLKTVARIINDSAK